MPDPWSRSILSQFEATLAMLAECIAACPDAHWDGSPPDVVGTLPFWEVAYHTLCFADCYMSPSNEAFQAEIAGRREGFHPRGMEELSEEHPSRRMEREELRRYVVFCRERAARALGGETAESLAGPSGFSWVPMTRAEMHLYNLRHVAHHTGQLTAYLRRVGKQTRWCKVGWREPTAPR